MPNYYIPHQQIYQPQMQQMPQMPPQQQQTLQNGGFVSAPNEAYARNYSVAPGNSVTFKDEFAPYVYTKTMGFSQLDRPIFEKYRLVKEEPEDISNVSDHKQTDDAIADIRDEIALIWEEIEGMKNVPKKTTTKQKDDSRGDD